MIKVIFHRPRPPKRPISHYFVATKAKQLHKRYHIHNNFLAQTNIAFHNYMDVINYICEFQKKNDDKKI